MEWLHVRVVRGSQKALAKKNSIKSLQDHTEPLQEELGLVWVWVIINWVWVIIINLSKSVIVDLDHTTIYRRSVHSDIWQWYKQLLCLVIQ